jgi:hypothetical protein
VVNEIAARVAQHVQVGFHVEAGSLSGTLHRPAGQLILAVGCPRPRTDLVRCYRDFCARPAERTRRKTNMDSINLWHWITVIVILFLVLYAVPTSKILARAGYSKWWTVVFFIPLLNIIALWVLAYRRWPAMERSLN